MTIFEVEAHSRAVTSIQALLSKYASGSFSYRIAERALDLAFNVSCTLSENPKQELLAEAQHLIDLQVQAKLLAELPFSPSFRPLKREVASIHRMVRRGTLRPYVADQLAQVELWLTTKECIGGCNACIR